MKAYISSDPQILGGTPVISGTRIPISRVLYLLSQGYTLENIAEDYPHLDTKVIEAVLEELAKRVDKEADAPKTSQI